MNKPDVQRARTISSSNFSSIVYLVFVLFFLVWSWAASQYMATQLQNNPSLGRPVFHHIYAPWSIYTWTFMLNNPFSRNVYPHLVYQAQNAALRIIGIGTMLSLVASCILGKWLHTRKGSSGDIFGSTRWSSYEEAKQLGLCGNAGLIIGGLKKPLGPVVPVRYAGNKNILMIAPPDDGKSSLLTTNLLMPLQHTEAKNWNEIERRIHSWGEEPNIFIPDFKIELWEKTSGYQRDVLKKDVFLLAPLQNMTDKDGNKYDPHIYASYNPLWSIRLGSDLGYQDCYTKAQNIIDGEGEGIKTHWDRTSLGFGAAVIEKLGFLALNRREYTIFSLPGLNDLVSALSMDDGKKIYNDDQQTPKDDKGSSIKEKLQRDKQLQESLNKLISFMKEEPDDPAGVFDWNIYDFHTNTQRKTKVKPSIYQAACEMERKDVRERASVYSSFVAYLSIYRSEPFQRSAKTSSFSWKDIAANSTRATTIYLGMNPLDTPILRPYIRLVVADALEELTRGGSASIEGRSVRKAFRPFWFALDEMAILKKMPQIEFGSGIFRGYGVYLTLIFQSLAQLSTFYGANEVLSETTGAMLFGRPARYKAAEEISEELGYETIKIEKKSKSYSGNAMSGGVSTQETTDLQKLPLLSPKEIMQIPNDKIIGTAFGRNFYLTKFPFFKNKSLLHRSKRTPKVSSLLSPPIEPTFVREIREYLGETKWNTLNDYIDQANASVEQRAHEG